MEEHEFDILHSRSYSCTPEQLFECWSNPDYFKLWWGPKGFSTTVHSFDFTANGIFEFTMHAPVQGNFQNKCEFTVIVPNRRISWKRQSKPLFDMEFLFEQLDVRVTNLIFRMVFKTASERDQLKSYVLDKNEENLDRLNELVNQLF